MRLGDVRARSVFDGRAPHHMLIGRLADVSLDEALRADDPEEEGLAENIGGSDTAPPGEQAVLTVKGMAVEFTVE